MSEMSDKSKSALQSSSPEEGAVVSQEDQTLENLIKSLPPGSRWFLTTDTGFAWSSQWTGVHEIVGFVRTRLKNIDAVEDEILKYFIQQAARQQGAPIDPSPPRKVSHEHNVSENGPEVHSGEGVVKREEPMSPQEIKAQIALLQSKLPRHEEGEE